MKTYAPINLTLYQIITPNITKEQIEEAFKVLRTQMITNQELYYAHHYQNLCTQLLNTNILLKGSLNSLGRKLGITAPSPVPYQGYNFSEMFRVNVLTKMGLSLQNEAILNIFAQSETTTPQIILESYRKVYPNLPVPTYEFVKRTTQRYQTTGVIGNVPKSDGVLPFWATDTHYSKLVRDRQYLFFTVKLPNLGSVTLKFRLPKKERFQGGKATRPTVFLNKKNQITFGFTIQKPAPALQNTQRGIGIDLGRVTPFVGTAIDTNGEYTPPFLPERKVNFLTSKIDKLLIHKQNLWVKQELNKERGHQDKSETLYTEYLRVRSKISRLKNERVLRVANQIMSIAQQYNASIILENLSWTPHSKWEHSIQQEAIQSKATRVGIRVKKVSPKNTSQSCPTCKNRITHSARATRCIQCQKTLNRDVLASRNIALKGIPVISSNSFIQSLHTRVTRPVTPGSIVSSVTRNTT